ncbi:hypothetical protein ACFTWH_13615 [Streptomyces sp. NPDC057011]|uniref:hypothetical protein n=1 Tax=unclassified Streptomyces TaxID=2593676 RepID=UPI003638B8B7
MPGRNLPPPPPPAHVRAWMDETALRADRALFLRELARRSLGLGRLLLLWAVSAVFAVGWTFVGLAVMAFEARDGLSLLSVPVYGVLGVGVLIPAGFWFAWGARRDREVRRLLSAWAAADRDPATDSRLRAPARSLTWLLSSFALGALGLSLTFAAAATSGPGPVKYGELTYFMGIGMILWITALLGAAKATAHYRWALRAFPRPHPARTGL